MIPSALDTDYLVVGSGATGMAFADTLLAETDARITIVDRHGKPGGHWNDAYPFVTLHQPSAFYGVACALIAYVESHDEDEEHKNRLCGPVPFPHSLEEYPPSVLASLWNQFAWSQDQPLRRWIRECRLDGFGRLIAEADRVDEHKQAILTRYQEQAMAAVGNLQALAKAGSRPA